MKRRDLEHQLSKLGWWLSRHGGGHDIWTNGKESEQVPRHNEINEYLAKKIPQESKRKSPNGGIMEIEGKIWKSGKFWLVEVPTIDVCTQGHTRKEALAMITDAIKELMMTYFSEEQANDLEVHVTDYKKDVIGITTSNNSLMLAFSLIRQREMSKSTIREVSERLGSKSPNAYAQYEKGKMRITLDQYERLLQAVNPNRHPRLKIA
jgi:predicted RNase H-like HicB family nuclease/predicted RNA binding protein YcfA (HicA-like mRNA interferase family)